MALIRRHSVLAYYAVAFGISWGGFLLAVGPRGFPATPEEFVAKMPGVALAMLLGPPVAGLLLTGLVDGRAGLRDLFARFVRWRVEIRWYGVALLTAPLVYMVVLLVLSRFSAQFLPGIVTAEDKPGVLVFGIVLALAAGIFEEIGWTGFAIPKLRQQYGVLATGLIAGGLWAAWHLLGQIWAPGASNGTFAVTLLLVDPFFFMVGYRVLMVWVYDRTGSLLLAVLMHMSLTASARILGPAVFSGVAGMPLLLFDIMWAVATWTLVAVVIAGRRQSARPPLQGQPV
jgi:membrane protease YdiL (CAAX protease family)